MPAARPLLAVAAVALAGCSSRATPAIQPDPEAPAQIEAPVAVSPVVSPPPSATPGMLAPEPTGATPRLLRNGRPATGNVMGRAASGTNDAR